MRFCEFDLTANLDYIVQGELGQFHEPFSTTIVINFVYHHVADETVFFITIITIFSFLLQLCYKTHHGLFTATACFKKFLSPNASIAMYTKMLIEFRKHMV